MSDPLNTSVPPRALLGNDVIVRDPDHPDEVVSWRITRIGQKGDVVIADYKTADGTEGCHGFRPDDEWPVVRARKPLPGVAA
jgi:hypothetical protein